MKKISNIIKTLATTLFLMANTYVCGMEHINYKQQAIIAAQHNQTNKFLALPNELLANILSHSDNSKSLQKTMPLVLSLSATCKQFDVILPTIIGQCYNKKEKNQVMKELLGTIHIKDLFWGDEYHRKRHAALILLCAGADNDALKDTSLLQQALQANDTKMIHTLVANKADLNQRGTLGDPDFFNIRTVEMAQLFVNYGVDLNAVNNHRTEPNILYTAIVARAPVELIKFYIDNNVNTTIIGRKGNCILHWLVNCANEPSNGPKKYIEIGKLLLNANSGLLSIHNKKNQTPLDLAKEKLDWRHNTKTEYQILKKLIALFKQYANNQQYDCFICFENPNNTSKIPCNSEHPDYICIKCLQTLSNCPLCNAALKK